MKTCTVKLFEHETPEQKNHVLGLGTAGGRAAAAAAAAAAPTVARASFPNSDHSCLSAALQAQGVLANNPDTRPRATPARSRQRLWWLLAGRCPRELSPVGVLADLAECGADVVAQLRQGLRN